MMCGNGCRPSVCAPANGDAVGGWPIESVRSLEISVDGKRDDVEGAVPIRRVDAVTERSWELVGQPERVAYGNIVAAVPIGVAVEHQTLSCGESKAVAALRISLPMTRRASAVDWRNDHRSSSCFA
jgi:hypothetical protein